MATAGKPIECRAAVLWSPKSDLVIERVVVAPPKKGEVRIKMVSAGICFSDVHVQAGGLDWLEYPIVLGHEGAGVVESVGDEVTLVKTGDFVIPLWCYQCGVCTTCVKGKKNVCLEQLGHICKGKMLDGTSRFSLNGQSVDQYYMVAAFSEYSVLPEKGLAKLPSEVDLSKMALYGCCVPTGYGAAINAVKIGPGSVVVVIGLGAIGLCTILGARDSKALKIIGVDINPTKGPIGLKFGLTDFVNPKDNPEKKVSDVIKEMTDGLGADYCFVCLGNISVAQDAIDCVRISGGEVIVIGLPDGTDKLQVSTLDLLFGKTLKGTWCGDFNCINDIPSLVKMYMKGTLPTDLLISHTLPLEKINEGLKLLKQGKSLRTVITFE